MGVFGMAGYYALGGSLGGQSGYYSLRWNRRLPSDWDYLGVRFELEDGIHYGYLRFAFEERLNGALGGIYGVLRGWSWETQPGVEITVIPEPGGMALLSLTSALLLLGRQSSTGLTTFSHLLS